MEKEQLLEALQILSKAIEAGTITVEQATTRQMMFSGFSITIALRLPEAKQ